MAISIDRYVRITSGRGGGASTPVRQLIARLFTTSSEIPSDTVVEFDNADGVASYFGTGSDEAIRATYYFGFVSKAITRARLISYARWANVDVGATILGSQAVETLSSYTALNASGFTVTLAGVDNVVTGFDGSGAASLTDFAALLQTAIRAAGATFANVIVAYNPSRRRFEFDSGNTGDETIDVADGAQTPLTIMGFAGSPLVRLSSGKDAQTPVEVLTETTDETNNFGTFLFTTDLTEEQYVANGNWNQSQNVRFMQMVPTTPANSTALSSALIGIDGNALTLTGETDELPEMLPMAIVAAIDYTALNSVVNFQFHEDNRLTPTVTTDRLADVYDPLRVSYMGQTQESGSFISFYQRGFLTGGPTAPIDMNKYANEMWLKSFTTSQFIDLLRNLGRISRNIAGRSIGIGAVQTAVNAALRNGTISVGGVVDNVTRAFIAQQTGDQNAFIQIQNLGYWFNVDFRTDTESDGSTTEVMVYTLIYNDDDVIRMVDGRHILV